MESLVDLAQPLVVDMGVNLRGSDIDMAQHLLHAPQVGPAPEQVRGETMTQRMHRHIPRHTGTNRVLLDQFPDGFAAESTAAAAMGRSEVMGG